MFLTLNLSRYLILDLLEFVCELSWVKHSQKPDLFLSPDSFLKPLLVRKSIWGNSYIEVHELLGFKPFCHLLYLLLVWHMHEYAGSATLLFGLCPVECNLWKVIHKMVLWILFRCWCNSFSPSRKRTKNDDVRISLTYLSVVVFIPRAFQSIASTFFWGSRWGVCCCFMGLVWGFYSKVLGFLYFRGIFQGLSYFVISVYWFCF